MTLPCSPDAAWTGGVDQPLIVAFPAGRERNGVHPAGILEDADPARWTSRHGSLVTTVYGMGTVDGFNDAGLAGHALYLSATDFGPREPAKPLCTRAFGCSTCSTRPPPWPRRLDLMDGIDIVAVHAHGHDANLHLALEGRRRRLGDHRVRGRATGRPPRPPVHPDDQRPDLR